MEISEFGQLFASFTKSAFRLETLSQYLVEEEARSFELFVAGQPLPDEPHTDWVDLVGAASAAGKTLQRVHVLHPPLTPYLRFELEWFYPFNAQAGEQIHILDHPDPKSLFPNLPFGDFWIFDDSVVVKMEYDADGRFLAPSRVSDDTIASYSQCRTIALEASIPFSEYLARNRTS